MSRPENPPFGRGETFNGTTGNTNDGVQMEGKEWIFEDMNPTTKAIRSNQYVTCRVVRNINAGALLPKRLANLALTPNANGIFGGQVDGYARTTAARGYPIDEFLPSTGVQTGDLFWVVVKGPAVCITDLAALSSIVVGDRVVAQTAATSGATTSGRIILIDTTGSTTPLANAAMNYIGAAMSAATTNNTNSSVLVDVGKW